MDSATPLEPAPAAGGAGESLAGGGIALAGQACPVSQGGGDTYPIFPEKNPVAVAVATPGTMVKCGMTKYAEVLLPSGPMLLFRLVKKSKSPVPATWRPRVATGSPYSPGKNPSPSPPKKWVVPHKTVDSG